MISQYNSITWSRFYNSNIVTDQRSMKPTIGGSLKCSILALYSVLVDTLNISPARLLHKGFIEDYKKNDK